MNALNKILKIICTAHADEYDNDLNGMSLKDLDERFSGAVKANLEADKEKMSNLSLKKRDDYKFVVIDSFEEARKYGKYTEWCVTHHSDMYENYTKGGLGRFYFCLQDGFEDVPKEPTEGCPLDTYGKSMIAISVNDDGSLNTCTCRWNHSHDGNDSMMTTEEISKFFGVNFYETFKPRSVDEVLQTLLKNKLPDDEFCKTFGCIKTHGDNFNSYKKLIDGKIATLPRVDDVTTYINGKFMTMKDGKFVEHVPEKIDGHAFNEDSSLTKIEIPHGVKSIGVCAFFYCRNLTNIIIPDTVERIGARAFSYCTRLKSIEIPDSAKNIGNGAFASCTSLTRIVIPESVKTVGEWAFHGCGNLTNIAIPDSVKRIRAGAFCGCKNLKSIEIPNSVKIIENFTFDGCTSLTNIVIPGSVESIGDDAFRGCTSLKSIEIPDSVKSIGDDAFAYCENLKNIEIPDSVKSIGDDAFNKCNNLEEAVFEGKTLDEVKSMACYPWGIDESVIKAELD
jgi:hypothetical protein